MHTYHCNNDIAIHHNGDYSGEAEIVTSNGTTIKIECKDLFTFVADAIRQAKISSLEQQETEEILGINFKSL